MGWRDYGGNHRLPISGIRGIVATPPSTPRESGWSERTTTVSRSGRASCHWLMDSGRSLCTTRRICSNRTPSIATRWARKASLLKYNSDGSLTLYYQHHSPGSDKESNWVPAPKDEFSLYIRAYWPKAEILEGRSTPPPVIRS